MNAIDEMGALETAMYDAVALLDNALIEPQSPTDYFGEVASYTADHRGRFSRFFLVYKDGTRVTLNVSVEHGEAAH